MEVHLNISITKEAIVKLREVMSSSDMQSPVLKIHFAGFGWGGPRMGLALDEHDENENYIVKEDIKISIDQRLNDFMQTGNNIMVDFRNSAYGSGFIVSGGSSC